ncbi:hypothetical protein Peur_048189 [Populus x canadensis]
MSRACTGSRSQTTRVREFVTERGFRVAVTAFEFGGNIEKSYRGFENRREWLLSLTFGAILTHVCVVEFQKRGLPHTHLLVWLAPEFKFRSAGDVDSVILAGILDKNQDLVCYEIVSKFMMHGPCSAVNPKAQSMEKNKCFK